MDAVLSFIKEKQPLQKAPSYQFGSGVAVDAPTHLFCRGSKNVVTDTRLAPYERNHQGLVQRCEETRHLGESTVTVSQCLRVCH